MSGFHVSRTRGDNPRAIERRQANRNKDRLRPGMRLDGRHMKQHPPTGTRKREQLAEARRLTGRPTMSWKGAKKLNRRLEREARMVAVLDRIRRQADRGSRPKAGAL